MACLLSRGVCLLWQEVSEGVCCVSLQSFLCSSAVAVLVATLLSCLLHFQQKKMIFCTILAGIFRVLVLSERRGSSVFSSHLRR